MDRRHHEREDEERLQRFEPLGVTFLDRKTGVEYTADGQPFWLSQKQSTNSQNYSEEGANYPSQPWHGEYTNESMEYDTARFPYSELEDIAPSGNQQHWKETHETEINTSSAGNDFSRVFTVTGKQQEPPPSYGRYHESQQTPAQGRYWSEQTQQWQGYTPQLSGSTPQWSAQDQQWSGQNQWPMTTSSNVTVTQPSATNNVVIVPSSKPENHLCMSIFVLICCFWPVGICAVVQSSQVNELYAQGKHVEAEQKSRYVRSLNIAAIVSGLITYGIAAVNLFFKLKYSNLI
uniref:Synapse differentiation-inducing gene protein 1-like n=1 Tax=Biomphalaria glabrata TaxID=6526 RepID=A0A2C9JXP7_BIOGL